MSLNTDLSGLFHIQKDYLAGLTIQDASFNTKVSNLATQLGNLHTGFAAANTSSSAVLARQQDVSAIVDEEKRRLEQKKQSIDNALDGKRRAIDLNETYRLRQSQYIRIKVVIVIVLVICILLTLLQRRFPIVPSIFITLLNLIVILIGGIYCLFIYSTISSRSPLNYNELDLAGPAAPTVSDVAASQVAASKAGNLLGTINVFGCVGSACCSAGTKWDNEKSKCVPDPAPAAPADSAASAAPADSAASDVPAAPAASDVPAAPAASDASAAPPTVGGFTTMKQSGPIAHSPSEYDSYGRV